MKSERRNRKIAAILIAAILAILAFPVPMAATLDATVGEDDAIEIVTFGTSKIYVPDNYSNIQEAVNAAYTGDTIIVRDGIFIENINVDKSLTIRSENGSGLTTVIAKDPGDHAFNVTTNYVKISGFTVEGATGKAGIYLYYAYYCGVSNNTCSNNDYGICLSCSSNSNRILNNNCSNNSIGIDIGNSNNNSISNNNCSNNRIDGIRLDDSNNNNISNNNCSSNNSDGISLWDSNNNNISNNNCLNNSGGISLIGFLGYSNNNSISNNNCLNNGDGIHLQDSNSNSISNNNCSNNGWFGIDLWNSNNNSMFNNKCLNNSGGISLSGSSNNKLTGNIMLENGIVIEGDSLSDYTHEIDRSNTVNGKPIYYWKDMEGGRVPNGTGQVILVNCRNIIVENQNLNNASAGIKIAFSSYITIKNNDCSNNLHGIDLWNSNNNSISTNNCSSKWYHIERYLVGYFYGIDLSYSNNNSISNNICSNNSIGIYLWNSNNNSVSNNNCSNNPRGIYLGKNSNNNSISNNNCSNNWYGIYLENSNNNIVYLNNFINNVINGYSQRPSNIWLILGPNNVFNSTEKIPYTYKGTPRENYLGNYWDDYTRSDADGDGIGDIPYSILSDIVSYSPPLDIDRYPLIESFEGAPPL